MMKYILTIFFLNFNICTIEASCTEKVLYKTDKTDCQSFRKITIECKKCPENAVFHQKLQKCVGKKFFKNGEDGTNRQCAFEEEELPKLIYPIGFNEIQERGSTDDYDWFAELDAIRLENDDETDFEPSLLFNSEEDFISSLLTDNVQTQTPKKRIYIGNFRKIDRSSRMNTFENNIIDLDKNDQDYMDYNIHGPIDANSNQIHDPNNPIYNGPNNKGEYAPCDLAYEFLEKYGVPRYMIAPWLCIINHVSNFQTNVVSSDGNNYGLFQIHKSHWCGSGGSSLQYKDNRYYQYCTDDCSNFLNIDISDDVNCARKIADWHELRAWPVYEKKCIFDNSGNDLDLEDIYLSTCDSNRLGLVKEDEKVMGLHVLGPKMALTNNPGKRLGKCETAQILKNQNVDTSKIPTILCIINWESSFITSKNNPLSDDYGLFQISSKYWCKKDSNDINTPNLCSLNCDKLLDGDITDDISCMKTILNTQGFSAWVSYNNDCNGNVDGYMEGCQLI